MGNGVSICDNIGLKRQLTVLVVGLDNSGKTCTSRALVGETITDVTPTVGFSKFVAKHKGITVNIYDLGGSSKIREIWQNYFAEAHGIVYVIDASDPERLTEAQNSLSALMKNPLLKGKPLLLLANKQDHVEALDEIDVADKLQLEALANECQTPTRIEICSATQGTGRNIDPIIRIGFHWLVDCILQHYEKIQSRVSEDVTLQKSKEDVEKEARRERIQKLRALQQPDDDASSIDPPNGSNPFRPLREIAEEWSLPGAVSEGKLNSSSSQAQIGTEKAEFAADRGSISAPGPPNKKLPALNRASHANSASPTAPKLNQRASNGKSLPPLKRNV